MTLTDPNPATKRCPKCRKTKGLHLFHASRATKTGKTSYCKACANAGSRRRREADPSYSRMYHLKRKYGVTPEWYNDTLTAQGGGCDICGVFYPEGRKMHVDHDHQEGHNRGILCNHCNLGLGHFYDDQVKLTEAIIYLRRHKKKEKPKQ